MHPLSLIDELSYVQKFSTYRGGRMITVEANVLGCLRPQLLSLEEHLPDCFVRHAEESLQGPGTGWVKLPHVLSPTLTRKNPAKKHHLNHTSKTRVLVYHALDAALRRCHLVR